MKRKKEEFTVVHGKDGSVHKRKRRSEWTTDRENVCATLDVHKRDWNAIADRLGTKIPHKYERTLMHAFASIPQPLDQKLEKDGRGQSSGRAAGVKFS